MPEARSEWPCFRSESPSKWTRSSPSVPDPLDPGPAGFAHRGFHHDREHRENSLAAFAAAIEAGAGIECDLRLTSDGEIVVFHDADASRLFGTPLKIAGSSLAQVRRLAPGESGVPTLDELLQLASGRVPLLLEVKVDGDLWRWPPALRQALGGYSGPFAIMSFDPRLPRLLRTNWPEARRGLVIRKSLPALRRWLALWLADPDFVAVEVAALGRPWVSRLGQQMPVYCWTVRSAQDLRQARVHGAIPIWEADGRP